MAIDLNSFPSPDHPVTDVNPNAENQIDLNILSEEMREALAENEPMLINNAENQIDLNILSEEMREALAENEPMLINNEPNIYDVMNYGCGQNTVVPPGRGRGQAPIPSAVGWQRRRPDGLPMGWWIDYRVRLLSKKKSIYKNYIDPESGRKFRSMKEVERYLRPELVLNLREWGKKRKRTEITTVRKNGWVNT